MRVQPGHGDRRECEDPSLIDCREITFCEIFSNCIVINDSSLAQVMFPADRNGVVGIKPTLGLTSCRGVIPESHNFDVVGTFGKTVADAATALDAIANVDDGQGGLLSSSVSNKSVLRGARFGMPWKRVWEAAAEKSKGKKASQFEVLMEAVEKIREAGALVLEDVDFPSAETIIPPDGWDW